MARKKVPTYELLWRNKFLMTDCHNLDDMIGALQEAADTLRAMKAAGVLWASESDATDDYITLTTSDPAVAARFGFEESE